MADFLKIQYFGCCACWKICRENYEQPLNRVLSKFPVQFLCGIFGMIVPRLVLKSLRPRA